MTWIPAAERLPDAETTVLLFRKGRVAVGFRSWERPTYEETFTAFWFWACDYDSWHDDEGEATVTHWMPLPDAPSMSC